MTKIVVTQPMEFSEEHKQRLDKLGDVVYHDSYAANAAEWLKRCKDADIICTGKHGFKEAWPKLHDVFVSLPFVGMGFLDLADLEAKNVVVANSPGCNRHAVSEWIIAMMITMFRRLDTFTNITSLPAGQPPAPTTGLAFRRVTILGKGSVGQRVGEICRALEMEVSYFERHDDLYDRVKDADVVVDTLSFNTETSGMLDQKFFAALKPEAIFITVSIGDVVDTQAMLAALDKGQLAFAASDSASIIMGDTTDPIYKKLQAHPKVLTTPHVAYNTDVTHKISNDMMIDNVQDYLAQAVRWSP
jgi:D-2-hydroxyacid dehydrogenase (NADP+)